MTTLIVDTEVSRHKVQEVADVLEGTYIGLQDAIETVFGECAELDLPLLHILDSLVMECEGCGWWCPSAELNVDQLCEECD